MTSSPPAMRAVRLSAPGPVGNLRLTTLPLPPERDGWVRIRVEAFGLNRGLDLQPGQSVLIRGGTSSVGLAAAALATWRGATVLSTTRRAGRLALLKEHGVEQGVVDPVLLQPRKAAGLPGGGQHRGATPLGQRGGGQAYRGGAAADQHGLTGLEV